MKSLARYLETRRLNRRFALEPLVMHAPVPGTGISVSFVVHSWFEYHNRA